MPGLFIGGGRHQDEGLETHLTGQEAMTFPSPTTTHVKEGRPGRQPRDMLFRTRRLPGAWRSAWPHGGAPAFRLKHAAARPQVPPAPPGGLGAAPGTQTGKLMQGLVPQRAVPSPHTEYLGITYCEGSNADRSSALGLRLNQQDKNEEKQKTHPVISTMSRAICKTLSARV